MGEEKAIFLTIMKTITEINLGWLNSAVGIATENFAKSETTQQDYLLIIYFCQEKKNILGNVPILNKLIQVFLWEKR